MFKKLKNALSPHYKRISYSSDSKWDSYILKDLKDCKSILDVGCGYGRFMSNDSKRIVGIDGSKVSVESCKSEGYNVVLGRVTKLPFKDNSFDAVNSYHVIEHLQHEEAHQMLKEIYRVTKPNGLICISTPLMNERFYWSFSHVKPYYPHAILHYFCGSTPNLTHESIGRCDVIKLKYRHPQLLLISDSPIWFLTPIFNFLSRFGITSFKRDAYTLILKKVENDN